MNLGHKISHAFKSAPSMPGSAQSLLDAVRLNRWKDPFGKDANSMDTFLGGSSSKSPRARAVGRAVGSVFSLGVPRILAGNSAAPVDTGALPDASAPPVDTSLPAGLPPVDTGSSGGVGGGGDPTGLDDPFLNSGAPLDPTAFTTDAGAPRAFGDPFGGADAGLSGPMDFSQGYTPGTLDNVADPAGDLRGPDLVNKTDKLGNTLRYGIPALGAVGGLMQRNAAMKLAGQYRDLGASQRGVGEDLVAQYKSGKLNPADQFAIDQWAAGALAQTRDYYARAGLSDSSMAKNAEAAIQNQAVARKQEALNNLLTMGTNILNITDRYQAMAVQAEMQANQALGTMAINFMSAYGNYLRYFG